MVINARPATKSTKAAKNVINKANASNVMIDIQILTPMDNALNARMGGV